MIIADLQKLTTIDFPDHLACTVFTFGCNFRCGFCHNPELVLAKKNNSRIKEEFVFNFLNRRRGILEGVVITGGEPTLQEDLLKFMEKIKNLGFKVKLDTNGTNPFILKEGLKKKLIDYIAMDLKSSLEQYEKVVNAKLDTSKIKESIDVIRNSEINYEFRTTILPSIHNIGEVNKMTELIKGSKRYVLQKFVVSKLIDSKFKKEPSPSSNFLQKIKDSVAKNVNIVEIRE